MKKQFFVFLLGLGLIASLALAQAAGGGGGQGGGRGNRGGGQGGGPGGGNFDPAARMAQLKTDLGVTDDAEWKVLEPKIQKINELRMQQFGGGRGRGGPGGGGQGGGNANPTPNPANESAVAKAAADLRTALDNKESTAEQIKVKLAALRDARAKAREALTKAQNELKELVTVKQEAFLVSRGILE